MVTAIVRSLREHLRKASPGGPRALGGGEAHDKAGDGHDLEVEIIFPVAAEAIATTDDAALPIVPGVSGGEGCSTAGGCATCPYMKMNSLDALFELLERLPSSDRERGDIHRSLVRFEPRKYTQMIAGKSIAALGTEPILHMRGFTRTGKLPDALVADMRSR
jgi:quinolinate synthase